MQEKINVIGVYNVPNDDEVNLIEVLVRAKPTEFEVGDFTQEDPEQPRDNWQVAYDEYYLNGSGDSIIGDGLSLPEDTSPTRLTFFLYFVDFNRPLMTPFGKVSLPKPSSIPSRLKDIIYTQAD